MAPILLTLVFLAGDRVSSHESRTIAHVLPKPEGVSLNINERLVSGNSFTLMSHSVDADGSVGLSRLTYRMDGTPIQMFQEGNWGGRMNRFTTDYGSKGATQTINEATSRADLPDRTFKDPTKLWFWKTQPKTGERVVVTVLAQNVIAMSKIRFTYEGDETMTLAGRTIDVHRVREEPLSAPGVYTLWWYDHKGMGVKRYHRTTTREFTDEIAYWY